MEEKQAVFETEDAMPEPGPKRAVEDLKAEDADEQKEFEALEQLSEEKCAASASVEELRSALGELHRLNAQALDRVEQLQRVMIAESASRNKTLDAIEKYLLQSLSQGQQKATTNRFLDKFWNFFAVLKTSLKIW